MATGTVQRQRNTNINDFAVFTTEQDNVSINSGAQAGISIPVTQVDGYEPVQVVGYYTANASSGGSGGSMYFPREVQLNLDGTYIHMWGRNSGSSTIKIRFCVFVLYKRV